MVSSMDCDAGCSCLPLTVAAWPGCCGERSDGEPCGPCKCSGDNSPPSPHFSSLIGYEGKGGRKEECQHSGTAAQSQRSAPLAQRTQRGGKSSERGRRLSLHSAREGDHGDACVGVIGCFYCIERAKPVFFLFLFPSMLASQARAMQCSGGRRATESGGGQLTVMARRRLGLCRQRAVLESTTVPLTVRPELQPDALSPDAPSSSRRVHLCSCSLLPFLLRCCLISAMPSSPSNSLSLSALSSCATGRAGGQEERRGATR